MLAFSKLAKPSELVLVVLALGGDKQKGSLSVFGGGAADELLLPSLFKMSNEGESFKLLLFGCWPFRLGDEPEFCNQKTRFKTIFFNSA